MASSLEEYAFQHHLKVIDVAADGDCFYHAVSRQIMPAGEESVLLTGPHIRRRLAYFLQLDDDARSYERRYTDTFKTSYAIYLQLLIKGDWADEFAVRATADMLNLTIHILNNRGN